jgi:hypothetical protein
MRTLLTAVLVLAIAPAASAFEIHHVNGTRLAPCQAGLVSGAGVAVRPYLARRDEALTIRTSAPAGTDYDLAVFDRATGAALASSASFTAAERVTVLLDRGQVVDVQACRRTGAADEVRLDLGSQPVERNVTRPQLVEVALDGRRDARRLAALGLDVTHAVDRDSAEVVVYSRAQRARLRGFRVKVLQDDLNASLRRILRARPAPRALPSGRTTYRALGDYGTDLKAIADQHPGHVRAVTLGASLEERPIEGVEIAAGVGRVGDGRPILLVTGLTHAREWPSGEIAIEFAIDLAKTYAAGTDPRVTALLRKTRVFVFPMANPDGFAVSRQAGAAMAAGDDAPAESTLPLVASDSGAYKRKNCRAGTPESQAQPCATRTTFGVDLNRAYSAYWGGDGSSSDPTTQQYRGPEPFSEPEAQAIRAFGQANQIQTYISFHTFTAEGRILRQPGFMIENDEVGDVTPDEPRMKALGDDMAASTQGISELGYATLGNITGPADDFLYYMQGTYGYTPELRGANFHTGYANAVIAEYEGFGSTAGRGWREALIVAGEYAANTADHVVLEGTAPPGATLRLRKDFALPRSTDTDGDGDQDVPLQTTPEKVDAKLTVPADGSFEWHVNPSKRPYGPADEAFTLTCERGGAVRATRTFTAARAERKTIDLGGCGPAATPTPDPTATPGPPGTVLRVGLRRAAFSARRANRTRGLRVRVVLRGPGSLRGVAIRLRDSRGRTVHRRRLGRLRATRTVRLTRLRRVRAGRHRLVLTARTASGAGVRAARRVRVRR